MKEVDIGVIEKCWDGSLSRYIAISTKLVARNQYEMSESMFAYLFLIELFFPDICKYTVYTSKKGVST